MTLPASGNISWNDICVEFSLNPSTAVWPASFYGKGGAPGSGSLSFNNFYGRSAAAAYNPMPGTYTFEDNGINGAGGLGASASVTRNAGSAVWTYVISGANIGAVSPSIGSGGSAATVTFNLAANTAMHGSDRSATVTLTQAGNTWTLNLFATAASNF
jgi:hypothetical protein